MISGIARRCAAQPYYFAPKDSQGVGPSRNSLRTPTMKRRTVMVAILMVLTLTTATLLLAQLGGARWLALSVSGDPGISWIPVTDTPSYRVLRDFAEPGATRRMHHHEATWHVLTLATGELLLTVEGKPSFAISPGQSVSLTGGVNHTFTNVGTVTATIVEVFGKAPARRLAVTPGDRGRVALAVGSRD